MKLKALSKLSTRLWTCQTNQNRANWELKAILFRSRIYLRTSNGMILMWDPPTFLHFRSKLELIYKREVFWTEITPQLCQIKEVFLQWKDWDRLNQKQLWEREIQGNWQVWGVMELAVRQDKVSLRLEVLFYGLAI